MDIVVVFGLDVVIVCVCGIEKVIVMIIDCNLCYLYFDLKVGGVIVVVEVVCNIVCFGGKLLVIIDGLNFGNFEKLEIFWEIEKVVDGISVVCLEFDMFVIFGNVLFYNEIDGIGIYLMLVIGMVGLVEDLVYIMI